MLIDPVCLMTCAPQLLHSFVYDVPKLGWHWFTAVGFMDLIRFACSRDLIIAEVRSLYLLPLPLLLPHVAVHGPNQGQLQGLVLRTLC